MRRGLRGRRANGTPPLLAPATIFAGALIASYDHRRKVSLGTGSQVVTWRDISRNGNDAIQGTSAQQPSQGPSGIDFDGTADNLACSSNGSLASGALLTVGLRMSPDVTTSTRVPVCKSQSTSGSWSVQTNGTALRMHIGTPGSTFGEVASALAASTERTYVWVYDGGGATNADKLKLWIDGVAQTVSFTGSIPATITATSDSLVLGMYADSAQYWDGKIKAAVMANAAATTAQRTALEAYLGGL